VTVKVADFVFAVGEENNFGSFYFLFGQQLQRKLTSGKNGKEVKTMKWQEPKLRPLNSIAHGATHCYSGTNASALCFQGLSASDTCFNGNSPIVGGCYVGGGN